MQMAADQRKKRLNPSSIVGHTSREQYKAKKKKLDLPRYDLKMKSNISLEWDDKKKSVVSKREQIGIARRDLIRYVDAVPHYHNVLADVVAVPQEIFDLKILKEVLSYEVWQTCLSEKEKKLLAQFLPQGADAYDVVQELLSGDNFHFGNPFLKWGATLCSGNFHPDAVLHRELSFKANKKAYYSEFQKYHNDMIGNLQMWKERWASCKDPEKEIVQKIWRSRKPAERSMPAPANESRLHDPNENLVATSDSCSWAADEKACGSDNLTLMTLHGESKRRKDFMECKYENSSDGVNVVARAKKGEKLCKRNIQRGDGAKYMSYIKVSKEQHQRVMSSMKHSGNSIQSRSLNHVLGNLDTFHVQPYEVFEEEERLKLHEHWLQLANKHLPAGIANWRRMQIEKQQLMKSLAQEIEENVKSLKEDEVEENSHNMLPEQTHNGESDTEPAVTLEVSIPSEEKEEEKSDSLLQDQVDNAEANQDPAIKLEDEEEEEEEEAEEEEEEENTDSVYEDRTDNVTRNYGPAMEDGNDSVPVSPQNRHLQTITFSHGSHEFRPLDLDSNDNHVIAKTDDFPSNVSEYPQNMNCMDVPVGQRDHLSSTANVWPAVSMPNAFYHSTSVSHEYAAAPSELSLGNSQVIEQQPAPLIDLESDMLEEDNTKNLLHRQSEDESFFNPYPNHDRHELLKSIFKAQGGLPYHHEQPAANVMMGTGPFPVHFREPVHPSISLELRQKRLNDIYMHQNIQENMYSDVGRYSIPRQEQHFTPLNIQDWAVNPVNTAHMSAPPPSLLNGGEPPVSQNWFFGENRGRGVWSGPEIGPNPAVGNGNDADQNLFSVISQCSELGSSATYDPMGPNERLIQPGNYGGIGGGASATNVVLPRTANPLNFLGGHEAAGGLKANNNLGWVNLPHHATTLQDPMGKPFLRPWNH